jgi:uncharacterized protein YkwD
VKNKVIRLRRLPSICLVLLFLVLVWTTPAFSMPGSDGVVVSFVEKQLSESATSDESPCGQGTYSPVNLPPSFYLRDLVSECPSLFERQVIFFVNHERNLVGLPPLELDVRLQTAARWMSNDMAAHSNVPADHVDSLERSVGVRVSDEGGYPYIHLGEVIAGGFSSPETVVNAWMNSPGHKARLLDPDYEHIGVGYAFDTGTDHWHYWTADLGSTTEPRQAPTLDCDPRFYLLFLSLIEK